MLLIVGASGGLGSGIKELLANEPGRAASYGQVRFTTRQELDLSSESSTLGFFERLGSELKDGETLHILNAAGISLNSLAFKMDLANWNQTLAVNLTGAFLLSKASFPIFKARPGSSLLFISSVVGSLGVAGTTAYAATKTALHGFVRSYAKELSRCQGRVNAIELGYFDRGMITQVEPEHLEKLKNQIPLGRLGTISEFFGACDFALKNTYVTGSIINLTGGLV